MSTPNTVLTTNAAMLTASAVNCQCALAGTMFGATLAQGTAQRIQVTTARTLHRPRIEGAVGLPSRSSPVLRVLWTVLQSDRATRQQLSRGQGWKIIAGCLLLEAGFYCAMSATWLIREGEIWSRRQHAFSHLVEAANGLAGHVVSWFLTSILLFAFWLSVVLVTKVDTGRAHRTVGVVSAAIVSVTFLQMNRFRPALAVDILVIGLGFGAWFWMLNSRYPAVFDAVLRAFAIAAIVSMLESAFRFAAGAVTGVTPMPFSVVGLAFGHKGLESVFVRVEFFALWWAWVMGGELATIWGGSERLSRLIVVGATLVWLLRPHDL